MDRFSGDNLFGPLAHAAWLARPDPMSMMIAATVASGAIGAVGAIQSGNAQNTADQFNAKVQTANQTIATQEAQTQAGIDQQQSEVQQGQVASAFAMGGVDVDSGTPLQVMAGTAANGELTRQLDLYRGQVASATAGNQAAIDTAQGSAAQTAGYIKAAGDLIGGGANAARLGQIQTTAPSSSFGF